MSKRSRLRRHRQSKKRRFKNGPRRIAGRILDSLEQFGSPRVRTGADIQKAIDALPKEGGTVFVEGTHVIHKPIMTNKKNVSIVGFDSGALRLLDGVKTAFVVPHKCCITFGNVRIEGGCAATFA